MLRVYNGLDQQAGDLEDHARMLHGSCRSSESESTDLEQSMLILQAGDTTEDE